MSFSQVEYADRLPADKRHQFEQAIRFAELEHDGPLLAVDVLQGSYHRKLVERLGQRGMTRGRAEELARFVRQVAEAAFEAMPRQQRKQRQPKYKNTPEWFGTLHEYYQPPQQEAEPLTEIVGDGDLVCADAFDQLSQMAAYTHSLQEETNDE